MIKSEFSHEFLRGVVNSMADIGILAFVQTLMYTYATKKVVPVSNVQAVLQIEVAFA